MKFYTTPDSLPFPIPTHVVSKFPLLLNDYYLNLITSPTDPIGLQAIPSAAELDDETSSFDPLAEEEQMPVPKLIHRFRDRVVLLVTGKCAMRCRFCFRKRSWTTGTELDDITDEELSSAAAYLAAHPEIHEILISGGDPLMLPFERLKQIILAVKPHVEIIRIATRIPAVWPQRVTEEIAGFFAGIEGLWIATHFNHPRELTEEAHECCKKLVTRGVPVINQTVLLAGVNDDPDILETLFRTLVSWRVKPHYLFHVDPVRGVRHFATGIERGLEILRAFRPRLSSLAVPTFAIDLPEGGGKVALQPQYGCGNSYRDIRDRKDIEYPDGGAGRKD